jgi:hypothetical protein
VCVCNYAYHADLVPASQAEVTHYLHDMHTLLEVLTVLSPTNLGLCAGHRPNDRWQMQVRHVYEPDGVTGSNVLGTIVY